MRASKRSARGITRYTAVDGTAELKDAIIAKFKRDNRPHLRAQPDPGVLRRQADLFQCLRRAARSGRRMRDPGALLGVVSRHGAAGRRRARHRRCGAPSRATRSPPAQLAAAITPRTKLFIHQQSRAIPPAPPIRRRNCKALGAVLDQHPQVVIASDEMYEHIYWAPEPFTELRAGEPAALRPHRHHQRRVQGLCHDRLADRLLRWTARTSSPP